MLTFRPARGFSLIELLVTISILALLLLAAAPSYSEWMANGKVRSVSEEIANGLRLAQAEAMRRNRVVAFVFTSAQPSLSATPASSGMNWYVQALPLSSSASSLSASSSDYVQGSSYASQSSVSVNKTSTMLCFGPLGSLVEVAATASFNVLGTGCSAGSKSMTVQHAAASRTLKVMVEVGGQIRLCDPSKTLSVSHPDGCSST